MQNRSCSTIVAGNKKPDSAAMRLVIISVLAERAAHNSSKKVLGPEVHQQLAYSHITTVLANCLDRLCPAQANQCPLPISMVEIDHLLFPSGLTMRLREQIVVNVSQLEKVLDTAFDMMAFTLQRPKCRNLYSPSKGRALPQLPPPPTYFATVKLQGGNLRPSQVHGQEISTSPEIRRSASLFALETAPNNQDLVPPPLPPLPPPRTSSIVPSNKDRGQAPASFQSRPISSSPDSHIKVTLPQPLVNSITNHPPGASIGNEQTLGSDSTLIDQDAQSNEMKDTETDEDAKQWKITNQAKYHVYVTLLLMVVPILVLIACIIFEGGILPVPQNPWVGPSAQSLVKWGARAVFCMRNNPATPDLSICGRGAPNQYWRFITSAFVSKGVIQVMFTSFLVARFGSQTEKSFGHIRTAVIFMLGHVGSMLFTAIVSPFTLETGSNGGAFALLAASLVDFLMHLPVCSHPIIDLAKWIVVTVLLVAGGWLLPFLDNTVHIVGYIIGIVTSLAIRPKVLLVRLKRRAQNQKPYLSSNVLDNSTNSASSLVVTVADTANSRSSPLMRSCYHAADFGLRLTSVAVLSGLFYMGYAVFYNIGGLGLNHKSSAGFDCPLCKFFNWSTIT